MKEYIVYVKLVNGKKTETGKMQTNRFIANHSSPDTPGNWKLVYFEMKSSRRAADAGEKKLRGLNKKILMDFVKRSNPELLDLKYTVNGTGKILEELIY